MSARESESDSLHTELMTSRQLKALSHPVRRRIIDLLSGGGPARAADLAPRLGAPANQVSFHLRTLAAAGLIEEAPEEARDRRDRVWRVGAQGYRVADPARPVEGADLAAVTSFMSNELHRQQELIHRVAGWVSNYASGQETEAKAEWSTYTFRFSQEEAREVLHAVLGVLNTAKRKHQSGPDDEHIERKIWDVSFFAAREDI